MEDLLSRFQLLGVKLESIEARVFLISPPSRFGKENCIAVEESIPTSLRERPLPPRLSS